MNEPKDLVFLDNLIECKKNLSLDERIMAAHWKQYFSNTDPLPVDFPERKEKVQAVFQHYLQYKKKNGIPFNRRDMVSDRLEFCRFDSHMYSQEMLLDLMGETHQKLSPDPTIAYWADNKPSETALEHFKTMFKSFTPSYAYSFREVCDMVADKECDMGVIPIENASDGKMLNLYRILEEKGLRICAADTFEGGFSAGVNTTFALISRGLILPTRKKGINIEISSISAQSSSLPVPLILSETLGAVLRSFSSVPVSYRDSSFCCYASFTTDSTQLLNLLLYFWLFGNDFTIYGIY